MHIATRLVHTGSEQACCAEPINVPIYQTSTFIQSGLTAPKDYHYSRIGNPTRTALEEALAIAETGTHAFAFGSGMAAIDAVASLLKPGDEAIVSEHLYGGSLRLFSGLLASHGIQFRYVDLRDRASVVRHLTQHTRMIWAESPSNPTLQVIDLELLATIGRERGIITVADNTFATPALQRPLELGVDFVVHSASKYLGGHSDVIAGAVITRREELARHIGFVQSARGAIPGPQDCFLVLRGMKTLYLRMQAHCENAGRIAGWLREQKKVRNVYWPGFTDYPEHSIAQKQMEGFGGVVSFDFQDDTEDSVQAFIRKTRIFRLAESLGGVESTLSHPASMSHPMLSVEERLRLGITPSLVRLSVGIENPDDLIEDLNQALNT
ncbi:MAG: cystathionine beta-lyase [Chitinophagales bacterium]|nr:MAG: cystathionine beta-lyase [Chitinophagales bacterium]